MGRRQGWMGGRDGLEAGMGRRQGLMVTQGWVVGRGREEAGYGWDAGVDRRQG